MRLTAQTLPFFLLLGAATAQDATEFATACAAHAKAAAAENRRAVVGADGWAFLASELAHIGQGPLTKASTAPAIKAITSYHKALAGQNVKLIVLPIPAKAEIYPDKLVKGAPHDLCKTRLEAFFAELKAAGVTAINLAPGLVEKGGETAYCQRDTHWSPTTASLAADAIFAELRDFRGIGQAVKIEVGPPTVLKISGDLMDEPHVKSLGSESVNLTYAGTPEGGKLVPVPAAADSPVILMGDSHTLVFSEGAAARFHCQGAGLLDHLQQRLGFPVMQISSPASGGDNARMQLARKAVANPEFWREKKAVVWCFAIREITEGKWREIPIKK